MTKEIPIHKDKLGRTLAVDDFVAYPTHNLLAFGKITKLNPKMVKIAKVSKGGYWRNSALKYSSDLIKLEPQDMTWYLLKNSE